MFLLTMQFCPCGFWITHVSIYLRQRKILEDLRDRHTEIIFPTISAPLAPL